jgi:RNA polymerase sigma factor (sigma-70 family)
MMAAGVGFVERDIRRVGASPAEDMAKRPQTTQGGEKYSAPIVAFDAAQRGGQKAAFETVVLLHLDAAYRLARYLSRRGDVADDIVQEAMLRAYRSFDSQRGDNVRAWLLAIVRNCFLTWKARESQSAETGNFEDDRERWGPSDEEGKEEVTPEAILIQHEEENAMRSLVEGLPHPFREVLVLRDIEDMSYREIAEITGVPIGTVMSRLARARKMFGAAWKETEMKLSKERQT